MQKITWLLRIVGTIQIILGSLYLFAPTTFLVSMGHSIPEADIFYPFSMLAARFYAFGIALFYISKSPEQHKFWIYLLIFIQVIDLAGGLFYSISNVVSLSLSAFPMFNALLIIILALLWMPKDKQHA